MVGHNPSVSVRDTTFSEIEPFRASHRDEAGCQIVRDSILERGLAEPFAIELDGTAVGYAGVWTEYFPGRVMELYLTPRARPRAAECFGVLLDVSGAEAVEAQTNLPQLHAMFRRFARDTREEKILFEDGRATGLTAADVRLRRRAKGDWVLERGGRAVATGGFLTHYNPPYADLYMEVLEDERGRGLGSYLVQELRRVCHASGYLPAARCDVANEASRKTLLRGGLVECGRLVAGRIV